MYKQIIRLDSKKMLKYLWNSLRKAKYIINWPQKSALIKCIIDIDQYILKR